ncbi:Multidrug resistance-associated protein [Blattamonas nauphoetae]|uniref:Multidrug resistance-associated protein n=1 Tax=Blattamonas nauphoetae TaxID=2049346 RepID=A0ABQ9XE68_9EUKA|nr:Multidrug resistance-associated protein [Blattamonas nauphoetae]
MLAVLCLRLVRSFLPLYDRLTHAECLCCFIGSWFPGLSLLNIFNKPQSNEMNITELSPQETLTRLQLSPIAFSCTTNADGPPKTPFEGMSLYTRSMVKRNTTRRIVRRCDSDWREGVNMSGGQKARIQLARAVYSDKDIFIIDDALSAVDARVGRYLMDESICGMLKGETVILMTNQLQFLDRAK